MFRKGDILEDPDYCVGYQLHFVRYLYTEDFKRNPYSHKLLRYDCVVFEEGFPDIEDVGERNYMNDLYGRSSTCELWIDSKRLRPLRRRVVLVETEKRRRFHAF